eukprot:m51a1_g11255 hypothetical protein (163) ;mRNA; r:56089-56703
MWDGESTYLSHPFSKYPGQLLPVNMFFWWWTESPLLEQVPWTDCVAAPSSGSSETARRLLKGSEPPWTIRGQSWISTTFQSSLMSFWAARVACGINTTVPGNMYRNMPTRARDGLAYTGKENGNSYLYFNNMSIDGNSVMVFAHEFNLGDWNTYLEAHLCAE